VYCLHSRKGNHYRSMKWCNGACVDLLTDLKNMTVRQVWDKQHFNFQKHIFGKSYHTVGFEAILL
jgi:hypothetical protein